LAVDRNTAVRIKAEGKCLRFVCSPSLHGSNNVLVD
jgi:hypothetical protein